MSEGDEMRRIQLAASKDGSVLFRNNVGTGVVGQVNWMRGAAKRVLVQAGDAVVRHARIFHAGLVEGSSDLVGWRSITITPEMVGSTVAVFAGVEAKSKDGRLTTEQDRFIKNVLAAGGLAGVARTPEEAVAILHRLEA